MTENEFLLADRIQKIKSINELYDLERRAIEKMRRCYKKII